MNRRVLSKGRLRAALSGHAALLAFLMFVLLAGSNPVAIRFSNLELPPFWGAAARFGAAALIFWAIVLARRIALPRGRALVGSVIYGAIGVGVTFALIYWALVRVQAGMASVFVALTPLPAVFLSAAHGLEKLRWRRLLGGLVASAGVALIVSGQLSRGLAFPVLLTLVAIPFAMAEGAVIVKLFPLPSPMVANAVAFSAGASMLAGLALFTGEKWSLPADGRTWAALGYLVVIGAVLVNYLWLFVLARWPATRAAYGPVLFPVVSVALSVWLTGEVVTPIFALGAVVTLAGVWLGAMGKAQAAPKSRPEPVARPASATLSDCPAGC